MKTLSARCDTDKMSCCQRQGGTSQRLTWGLACLNTASCKQLCILPVHCKGIIISAQLAANTCSREKRRATSVQLSITTSGNNILLYPKVCHFLLSHPLLLFSSSITPVMWKPCYSHSEHPCPSRSQKSITTHSSRTELLVCFPLKSWNFETSFSPMIIQYQASLMELQTQTQIYRWCHFVQE